MQPIPKQPPHKPQQSHRLKNHNNQPHQQEPHRVGAQRFHPPQLGLAAIQIQHFLLDVLIFSIAEQK